MASFPLSHALLEESYPGWHLAPLLLLSVAAAALVWAWIAAYIYGAALHLGAVVVRGRTGLRTSLRAMDRALICPGLCASLGMIALASIAHGEPSVERGVVASAVAILGVLVFLASIPWSAYTLLVAVRVRHGFGWWRAVGACVAGVGVVFFASVVVTTLLLVALAAVLAAVLFFG